MEEQLDRAMVSYVWKTRFRNALLTNLIASHSDHSPIVLDTEPHEIKRSSLKFRFENKWLQKQDIPDIIQSHWNSNSNMDVIVKLLELSANISTWSQHLNRDLRNKIASIKDQIDRLRHKPTLNISCKCMS